MQGMMNWNPETQEKSEAGSLSAGQAVYRYILDMAGHQEEDMTDEEKQRVMQKIRQKIESGKKLSAEEERLLMHMDPYLYQQYRRIRALADGMAEKLKHARSKQEANDIIFLSMSTVSKSDPFKAQIIAAMSQVEKEFRTSPAYGRLPNKAEDVKDRNRKDNDIEEHGEEDEEDLMSWTPLKEVIDAMPVFNERA